MQVRVPHELLMVPMDALLIEQVLLNLLENAVIHGKGATRISLTVSARQGNAVFEVRDNGCGIDPQVLPRLFEQSVSHGDSPQSDSRRSLGIGLSVCNTIIRAHNGSMSARNLPEGGAAVQFTLPLEDSRNYDLETKDPDCEDEPNISNFMSTILTANDFTVLQASNGADGLMLAASHCPDVILLDLGLPDMTARPSSRTSASGARCRSLWCRPAARSMIRWRASIWGPTTM